MISNTGSYRMLTQTEAEPYLTGVSAPPSGEVVAFGTAEDIREIASRVRLGAAERDRRRERKQMQRRSRKRNR